MDIQILLVFENLFADSLVDDIDHFCISEHVHEISDVELHQKAVHILATASKICIIRARFVRVSV